LWAILWETILVLILVNIPVGRQAFGLVPVGVFEAGLVIGWCLVVLLSIEITKRLLHLHENRKMALGLNFKDNV